MGKFLMNGKSNPPSNVTDARWEADRQTELFNGLLPVGQFRVERACFRGNQSAARRASGERDACPCRARTQLPEECARKELGSVLVAL